MRKVFTLHRIASPTSQYILRWLWKFLNSFISLASFLPCRKFHSLQFAYTWNYSNFPIDFFPHTNLMQNGLQSFQCFLFFRLCQMWKKHRTRRVKILVSCCKQKKNKKVLKIKFMNFHIFNTLILLMQNFLTVHSRLVFAVSWVLRAGKTFHFSRILIIVNCFVGCERTEE